MSDLNITFIDNNEATLHEKILARMVAEALFFQVRLQNEDEKIKNERIRMIH